MPSCLFCKFCDCKDCKNSNDNNIMENQEVEVRRELFVPFDLKNEAKKLGAKYDPESKKWYASKKYPNYKLLTDKFDEDNLLYYAKVSYGNKQIAKELGAYWYKDDKCWVIRKDHPNYNKFVEKFPIESVS